MGSKLLLLLLILVLVAGLTVGCSKTSKAEAIKVNCCDGSVKEFSLAEYSYFAKNDGIYLIDKNTGTQHHFSYEEFNNIEW